MPGSGKQPPEIQEQIKELLEAGFDPTTIHRRLKVGRSSIYRMKRCLQQHGTNYMPPEMNKKNGRPKVLTPDQELEVREWLRDPKNRTRFLDDLVWLIHDRFGIVCSTTTMSKMKRKWLRVIEFEETGQPIDDLTRSQLMETHPDLPVLQESAAAAAQAELSKSNEEGDISHMSAPQHQQAHMGADTSFADVTTSPYADTGLYTTALQPNMGAHMQTAMPQQFQDLQASMGAQMPANYVQGQSTLEPQIDSQLEQQLNHDMSTSADLANYGQPTAQ